MQKNTLSNVEKHYAKLKSMVQKINDLKIDEIEKGWNSYSIKIVFDKPAFDKKFDLFQEFFDYLTNSKVTLAKKTNREMWRDLDPLGYIKFIYGHEEIHLDFVIITQKHLNFLDFRTRIQKCLVPNFSRVMQCDLNQIVEKFDDQFLKCETIKVFLGSH